jgi:ribonuclease P protein component
MERSSSKLLRLRRAGEFRRVRETGVSYAGKLLVVGVWRKELGLDVTTAGEEDGGVGSPDVRFGVVTSRKVGGAVVRNLVRRRIRHIHRAHRPEVIGSLWCVTVARYRASKATFAELDAEWCKLAKRAGVLKR